MKPIIVSIILACCLVTAGCRDKPLRQSGDGTIIDVTPALSYVVGEIGFDASGSPMPAGTAPAPLVWLPFSMNRLPAASRPNAVIWIRVPVQLPPGSSAVLFIPGGSYLQHFDVYLAGALVYRSWDRLDRRALPVQPHMIPLPSKTQGGFLYLRFHAFEPGPMGFVDNISIATERAVINRIMTEQIDRLILGSIFAFTGLLALFMYLKTIRRRNHAVLAFALMSVAIGLLVAFSSDLATIFFISPQVADHVTLLSIIVFPIGLFMFIDQTIGPGFKFIIRRSWQLFVILAAVAVVAIAARIDIPVFIIFFARTLLFIIAIVAALGEMSRAIISGRREARIISIGLLIFGFYATSDILMKMKIVHYRMLHFHWGYLILMVLLAYLLYRRFEDTRDKLRRYSDELEEKSMSLQDLNRTLEERVQERTEELQEKNTALKQVNQALGDRNRIIEYEVAMARKIQQQLIPASAPISSIAAHYRPMDQVGGDFYDFIPMDRDDRIGIFISDVSGHGIPAALITSMVKTIILQSVHLREDPAALFTHINETLYGKTGDNFITAFYGILDLREGVMTWCNAGHNPPFVVGGDGAIALAGKRSLPLASMENRVLAQSDRLYQNVVSPLPPGSKLFLYTDGLTEAVHTERGGIDFETGGMMDVLCSHSGLNAGAYVARVYEALVAYRGCDCFDDDVCLICVDL